MNERIKAWWRWLRRKPDIQLAFERVCSEGLGLWLATMGEMKDAARTKFRIRIRSNAVDRLERLRKGKSPWRITP